MSQLLRACQNGLVKGTHIKKNHDLQDEIQTTGHITSCEILQWFTFLVACQIQQLHE